MLSTIADEIQKLVCQLDYHVNQLAIQLLDNFEGDIRLKRLRI